MQYTEEFFTSCVSHSYWLGTIAVICANPLQSVHGDITHHFQERSLQSRVVLRVEHRKRISLTSFTAQSSAQYSLTIDIATFPKWARARSRGRFSTRSRFGANLEPEEPNPELDLEPEAPESELDAEEACDWHRRPHCSSSSTYTHCISVDSSSNTNWTFCLMINK